MSERQRPETLDPEAERTRCALAIVRYILAVPKWEAAATSFNHSFGGRVIGHRHWILSAPEENHAALVNDAIGAIGGIPATIENGEQLIGDMELLKWHGPNLEKPGEHNWLAQPVGMPMQGPISADVFGLMKDLQARLSDD